MRVIALVAGLYFIAAWALMLLVDLVEGVWFHGMQTLSYGGSCALIGGVACIAGAAFLVVSAWGWLCGLGE